MKLSSIKYRLIRTHRTIKFIFNGHRVLNKTTYYPECTLKSKWAIFVDNLLDVFLYGRTDPYYFMYGRDRKGVSRHQFVHTAPFERRRNALNHGKPDYGVLLDDKSLFEILADHYNMPTVKNLAVVHAGETAKLKELFPTHPHLFLKLVDAGQGKGALTIDADQDGSIEINHQPSTLSDLDQVISNANSPYLVQDRLIQHPEIGNIYPHAINTMRIVTVKSQLGGVELMSAGLRIGSGGASIDNLAQGGMVVGIGSQGTLKRYAFFAYSEYTKTTKHPDTGFEFEGFKMPYYAEAVQLCKTFHEKLGHIHSIGWDVAITDRGPVFIEGNENWAIEVAQMSTDNFKELYENYFF